MMKQTRGIIALIIVLIGLIIVYLDNKALRTIIDEIQPTPSTKVNTPSTMDNAESLTGNDESLTGDDTTLSGEDFIMNGEDADEDVSITDAE